MRFPWPNHSNFFPQIVFLLLFLSTSVVGIMEDIQYNHKSVCFSCGSFAYLPIWNRLMHHYFPPKNFTDRCWQPDTGIGVVQCSSACFTLVEKIDQHDYDASNQYHGVLRGCVDRFLLFGLDDDVRNVLTQPYPQRICRQTDRKLLRLQPLSDESELVTFCSCTGDHCNDQDMLLAINYSSNKEILAQHSLLIIFIINLLRTFL